MGYKRDYREYRGKHVKVAEGAGAGARSPIRLDGRGLGHHIRATGFNSELN